MVRPGDEQDPTVQAIQRTLASGRSLVDAMVDPAFDLGPADREVLVAQMGDLLQAVAALTRQVAVERADRPPTEP